MLYELDGWSPCTRMSPSQDTDVGATAHYGASTPINPASCRLACARMTTLRRCLLATGFRGGIVRHRLVPARQVPVAPRPQREERHQKADKTRHDEDQRHP